MMIRYRKIFFTGVHTILLLLIGFFFNIIPADAQESVLTHNIKDNHLFYLLPRAMFLLKAPSDTANILNEKEQDWFKVPGNMAFNIGSVDKDIWMRFSVDNTSDTARDIALVLGSHRLHEVFLYEKNNGILKEKGIAGLKYPMNKQPYPFFVITFPLHIAARSVSRYYLKMDRDGISALCIPLLLDMKELKYQEQRTYLSYGILMGIIFLSGIFNLFLFFVLKEKIHVYYFLYSICAVWILFSINRLDFQFLFPNHPSFSSVSRYSSVFIFTGFLFLIMQTFLGQTKSNSRFFIICKWIRNICFIYPVIEILRVILPVNWVGFSEVHFIVYEWIISISLLMVILSCIEKILQKNQLAWFYLLAISVTVIGGMLSIIAVSGLVDWSFLLMPPSTVEIGLTLEAIIICFGILYRYKFYKKEKDALTFQLQEEKIKAAGAIIATQEQEQRRIAADLHDELGGNLAAIKMTLQSFHLPAEQEETMNYLIDRASSNTRHIAHDLMPPEFENTSLLELLDKFYLRLNTEGKINFHFHFTGTGRPFSKQNELMIYRIILELTNNIIKHSKATEATIQFIYYDDHLEIMVEDNGTGIIDKNASGGIGLKTVQSRLDYLRSNMNIDSGAKGTTIIIQIPYILT